ncbi:unnamed protein product, partial [Musa acuminata var. zebrina]
KVLNHQLLVGGVEPETRWEPQHSMPRNSTRLPVHLQLEPGNRGKKLLHPAATTTTARSLFVELKVDSCFFFVRLAERRCREQVDKEVERARAWVGVGMWVREWWWWWWAL